jgi:predicted small lipoprotein YifL
LLSPGKLGGLAFKELRVPVPLRWLIVSLCTAAALVGCGKKGPLYLPQEARPATGASPAPAPPESAK